MDQKKFSYWKYPWLQWVVLAGAFLQIAAMWMDLNDLRTVAGAGIFTPEALAVYIDQEKFRLLTHGVLGFAFFGIFLMGNFIASKKEAKRMEAGILFSMASVLSVGVFLWRKAIAGIWIWCVILAAAFGCSAVSFFQSHREKEQSGSSPEESDL